MKLKRKHELSAETSGISEPVTTSISEKTVTEGESSQKPSKIVLKKVSLIIGIAIGSVALLWGGLTLLRSANRQAVNVYAVSDFSTTDDWGNSSQSSGIVSTDKLQKIYLSSTQTVTKIYVEEGQSVKKGDKLLDFDTTLSALDLKRAEIQVERCELTFDTRKAELETLQSRKTRDALERDRAVFEEILEREKAKARIASGGSGESPVPSVDNITVTDGTAEHPFYIEDSSFTYDTLNELNAYKASNTDLYAVVYNHNAVSGDMAIQGVVLDESGVISFFTPGDIPAAEDTINSTAYIKWLENEIAKIDKLLEDPLTPEDSKDAKEKIGTKQQEVHDAEVALKLAKLDYQQKKSELEDGAVYATLDGIVKIVRDETEAFQNSQAILEVSGGGGYYITGAISELDLANVSIGDTVQINSWMTGVSCDGEIVSVEDYPSSDQNAWSGGNQNVSYYPFRVFVSEDADLQENDYVDVTYRSISARNCWYLDNMFIRTENGKSYVFVQGENGRLEQRYITTGSSLWGSYTAVISGLTQDDYIAFPYGKDVVAGAKTQQSTMDTLYGW